MNARKLTYPLAAVVVAAAVWQFGFRGPAGVPACTWRLGSGVDFTQGKNFEEYPAESPVRLSFHLDEPRYVYVFSHSLEDGTLLLFPSPLVVGSPGNPLGVGQTVLPGTHEGKELAWTTRAGVSAATTFLAVASRDKVAELEELAPKLRLWSNSVLTDRSMLVTQRGNAADLVGKARSPLPSELLERAMKVGISEPNPNGPMAQDPVLPGVWISSWKVREKKGTAPAPAPTPGDKK